MSQCAGDIMNTDLSDCDWYRCWIFHKLYINSENNGLYLIAVYLVAVCVFSVRNVCMLWIVNIYWRFSLQLLQVLVTSAQHWFAVINRRLYVVQKDMVKVIKLK